MSTTELREKLIEKIQLTNDESILTEINRVLDLETSLSEIYILSSFEKNEIELSRKEIQEGFFLTNDEVNKEIDEWLNK